VAACTALRGIRPTSWRRASALRLSPSRVQPSLFLLSTATSSTFDTISARLFSKSYLFPCLGPSFSSTSILSRVILRLRHQMAVSKANTRGRSTHFALLRPGHLALMVDSVPALIEASIGHSLKISNTFVLFSPLYESVGAVPDLTKSTRPASSCMIDFTVTHYAAPVPCHCFFLF
jgi:hypothetical protein